MLKIDSYSAKGTKLTPVSLPKEWESKENPSLIAQAIRVYNDRSHGGLRKAQTRAEVKRTGKKLYSQKGTGGARHGSRRGPTFVGGGVALGPRPIHRTLILPLGMKRKAMAVAMTMAVENKMIVSVDLGFTKTTEAQNFINKVLSEKNRKTTFVISKDNLKSARFLRNIDDVKVKVFPAVNAFDIFYGGNIVMDKAIFAKETKKK